MLLFQELLCSSAGLLWTFFLPIIYFVNILLFPLFIAAHLLFWLAIFLPIMLHRPYVLNSNDGAKKHFGRAFGISFAFYYISMLIVAFAARVVIC